MRNKQSTLVYKWFEEVWNKGNEAAINQLLADKVIINGIKDVDETQDGHQGFIAFYKSFNHDFADINVVLHKVVSEDDYETCLCTLTAKHRSSATTVTLNGLSMIRIERDQIVEAWNHFDFLSMYQQLGYELVSKVEEL